MLRLDEITDFDTLRQAATILEKENQRLHKRLRELTEQLAKHEGTDVHEQLALELSKLQEEMASLQRRMFSPSSERRSRKTKSTKRGEKRKQKGHGPRAQPQLPGVERIVPLGLRKTCPFCNDLVELWSGQYEESQQITVVRREFVLETIKREKGKCPCGATVVTAPGPLKLIKGGRYSLEFAIEVAIAKYSDHLPLERQVQMMRRDGLEVDSQTLWDQLWALYRLLYPLHREVLLQLVKQPVVHVDETRWFMLKGPSKTWQLWAVAVPDAVYYEIRTSRSAEAARELLAQYEGILVVDGYKAYETLSLGSNGKYVLAFCWAHVRRNFVDCSTSYPDETDGIINLIGELYDVERMVPNVYELKDDEAKKEALKTLSSLRNEQSREIIGRIKEWSKKQRTTPGSALRKAIEYMTNHWKGLTLFLDNPLIPLDNNRVERALRGPVVGRKNHYGSKSERGTEVAALFYTLLETAKLRGVDPRTYLLEATRTALEQPGMVALPGEPPRPATPLPAAAAVGPPAGQLELPAIP